jgi:ketosteroid isomerase-like protein
MRSLALVLLLVSTVAHARPNVEAELKKLIAAKIAAVESGGDEDWFAAGGEGKWMDTDTGSISLGMAVAKHTLGAFNARVQPDGETALITYTMFIREQVSGEKYGGLTNDTNYRVTEIAKKTPKGWRVVTALWSSGRADKDVFASAKKGELKPLPAIPPGGDKTLIDAFTKLTTGALDADASKRKDLVLFGSAPGERMTSGAVLAKAWGTDWANKLAIDSIRASAADPKATLGYVIANVTQQKKGFSVQFRALFAFERKGDGQPWSVVHVHLVAPTF